MRRGDRDALDRLFGLVYQELHALAHRHRQRWQGDHTLNTTALVHETYLKLARQERLGTENRAHFLALAAEAIRHILCNYARGRGALKRGGDLARVTYDEELPGLDPRTVSDPAATLLALDDALLRLEQLDPRLRRLVECRFFGGMTVEETAAATGLSPRTVKRDWVLAQAWLYREITSGS